MHATALLALLGACQTPGDGWVRGGEIADLGEVIGGPKSQARTGDFLLENDRIRIGIIGGRYSMGPGLFGGGLVDADLQRIGPEWTDGAGNDRLAEIFSTVNMNVIAAEEPAQVTLVSDGSDGAATVRVEGSDVGFITLLEALWAFTGAPDYHLHTDYILEPAQNWVTMRTTAFFEDGGDWPESGELVPGTEEPVALLEMALETGLIFGDFYLQGGDVDLFLPGLGFDEKKVVYEAELEGRNTFHDPVQVDFVAGTAPGVSYGLATLDGDLYFPLFTSSQTAGFGAAIEGDPDEAERFPAGTALSYERIFVVGQGDIGSVYDGILEARGIETGRVDGWVLDPDTLDGVSNIDVLVYEPGAEAPWSQWETDVALDDTDGDGSFGGTLPVGDWELQVHAKGRPLPDRVPVTVTAGGAIELALEAPVGTTVHLSIEDEQGRLVPGKVTVFRTDGEDVVRSSVLGDGYIAGDPESLIFLAHGTGEIELPPGRYEAVASRGPEYELDIVGFEVKAASPIDLPLQVVRSVETEGWISADFHVHAQPSHDSGVTPPMRVTTMVAEGVEYMVSTDHDYITDFDPTIEEMGLEPWINAAIGLEVTPVETGHYLGWPVVRDALAENGGAPDWTGLEPDEILDSIREIADPAMDDPITYVAHPRDGILGYFDQYGFSPYGGSEGVPLVETSLTSSLNPLLAADAFSMDFDALELLNGKRFEILRIPTQKEYDDYAAGADLDGYDFMVREDQEQQDLIDGVYGLGYGGRGQIDDWFTLLNLGFRFAAIGNSDTHGTTSTESGCPRNYVVSTSDDPAYIDDIAIAEAVRAGQVITTSGPFVRFWADDPSQTVGSEIEADGPVELYVEVQSATWYDVDRVELYENGTLIHSWSIDTPNADVINLAETFEVTPAQDSWYVVMAMGDDTMAPLFTPVEIPPVQLQDVVIEALASVPSVSGFLSEAPEQPRAFPTYPLALTNPIWIDVDGGGFQPPGVPDWMVVPTDPAADE